MRSQVQNVLCVLTLIALGWLALGNLRSLGQVVDANRRVQWEYRVEESHMSPELLNRRGGEGWELVNTLQIAHDTSIIYQFIFKRAR